MEGKYLFQVICREVLRRSKPDEKERVDTIQFTDHLIKKLKKALKESHLRAEVKLQGSIAKDTWLAGEKDVDIFILLPKALGRRQFQNVLKVVKRVAGEDWKEAYAEHPYIEAKIEGFTVDFVPCFKIKNASEAVSSVDRTPLHTKYMKKRLDERMKDEVRLLKRFMRGIGTYGAEIKVGGFSGYLCEVLILYYGSFMKLLEAAAYWRRGEIIDLEGHYVGEIEKAEEIFRDSSLIVIDPIDKTRNVASSVKECRLNEFIAASREFLKHPSLNFFYPEKIKPFSPEKILREMNQRGTSLMAIKFRSIKTVPDVLWGKLYKSQKAISNLIQRNGFRIINEDLWSDEENINIFLFELESSTIPALKKHQGPPIEKIKDCERFLEKYLKSDNLISGPKIEDGRWIVWIKRRYTNVVDLLKKELKDGGRHLGIASLVAEEISKSLKVLIGEEIIPLYISNSDFAHFLTEYLTGRLKWLSKRL
ncbi:TPA: CCA tRNA nucleotidyltransferase [Candidatus Bathyarchaeota archaeon]|nr:CCA tRNA nucleotidyltransferase [Candidatus Bathyarchaeota archaeon]